MKFERLVIESGDSNVVFDLHPRLTVISGLEQMERDGLVNEFVGALGDSRAGVHLELMTRDGHRFAVFRPEGAEHRVIDVDNRVDVTSQFCDEDGNINLLSRASLDHRSARKLMRFTAQDLLETAERDKLIHELAQVDQDQLWVAAETLASTQRRLEEEAEAIGSSVEDAEVIERIEQRHAEFESRQLAAEQVRKMSYLVAGVSALLSIPMSRWVGSSIITPLAMLAFISVGVSFFYWRRMEQARKAESDALADAGAQSYLGFHLQRVNSLLSSDSNRRRLMKAADEHRLAAKRWAALAGNIAVDWAIENRGAITAVVKTRHAIDPSRSEADRERLTQTATVAHAVTSRLAELRNVNGSQETFPALFDQPFSQLDSGMMPALLEVLVRSSEDQQIIFLTDSDTIASWARVEAMTGALGIIEPAPTSQQGVPAL